MTEVSVALGDAVRVVVDRPMGSCHPEYPELRYCVNYGYIPGTLAADGEEEDAYILGVDHPVEEFFGRVIAVIIREDDEECKWVVAPEGRTFTKGEIRRAVRFQEQYFRYEVCMPPEEKL